MPKKTPSQRRAAKKKKQLQESQTISKSPFEKDESKSEKTKKNSKKQTLKPVFLQELYEEWFAQLKEQKSVLIFFSSIELYDDTATRALSQAIKDLEGEPYAEAMPPHSQYSLGIQYYVRACFGSKDKTCHFDKAIIAFEKAKQENSKYTHNIERLLFEISKFYISSNILEQDATTVKNYFSSIPHDELVRASIPACEDLVKKFHYQYAVALAKIAYDMLDSAQNIPNSTKSQVIYNIANIAAISDPIKALKYLEEAEKFAPGDQDIIHSKLEILNSLSLTDQMQQEAEKLPLAEELLYKMYHRIQQDPSFCIKESAPLFNMLEFSDDTMKKFIYKYVKPKIDTYQKPFNVSVKAHKDILLSIDGLFEQCMYFNSTLGFYALLYESFSATQIESLLRFCKSIYAALPALKDHKSLSLKYREFILYSKCSARKEEKIALNVINKWVKDPLVMVHQKQKFAQYAGEMYIADLVQDEKFNSALNFIENEFLASETDKQKHITLIKQLITAGELRIEQQSTKLDGAVAGVKKQEPKEQGKIGVEKQETTLCLMDWAATSEELESYKDPRVIHAYYKNKKEQLYKQQSKDAGVGDTPASWDIGSTIPYEHHFKITQRPHFHAAISNKILEKLDSRVKQKFLNAIEKGLVTRKESKNGIKFIGNELIELKIKADTRLYTNKIYKNSDGEYLIIFDHSGTHQAVAKATKGIIEIIETTNTTLDISSEVPSPAAEPTRPIYDFSYFEQKNNASSRISDSELSGDQDPQEDVL